MREKRRKLIGLALLLIVVLVVTLATIVAMLLPALEAANRHLQ